MKQTNRKINLDLYLVQNKDKKLKMKNRKLIESNKYVMKVDKNNQKSNLCRNIEIAMILKLNKN